MALRALLWDVDGTLAETERDGHRVAFNRAFAEAGLPLHWQEGDYGRWLEISGGHERLRFALTELEGEPPEPERVRALQVCKQRHYTSLLAAGGLGLRPGVAELVAEARAAGLAQAIVTTSGRQALQGLEQQLLGSMGPAFSLRLCGEDVARKKPDPEAYQRAVTALGWPAADLLAIEDSPQGLAAATAAGLPCLLTLSHYSRPLPLERFASARAVVSGLGADAMVLRGPPCQAGRITLSYLQSLL
ncbi:HAD-IA family hydrolase [Cyanobium sp. NS01]|uniref:HAD-IA family hydrolase n=1 Tax=Cyanobium sp. NS01 TaxID=261284 RepID=UPI001644E8B4|nr:HAD-IA family hydrolase [Cyanobium sp. NS01]QNI70185.1 HAD hydrolase/ IA/ variant 3 family protein [Cyanobium sp. NS01]